jgi:hypothetical protein
MLKVLRPSFEMVREGRILRDNLIVKLLFKVSGDRLNFIKSFFPTIHRNTPRSNQN